MRKTPLKKQDLIVLIGPPNSGKTTIFNWLTGFKHRTVNYPGSTALISLGKLLDKYNIRAEVADTPGAYSLFTASENREAAAPLIKKLFTEAEKLKAVLLVLDAGKLEVELPLFFQLREMNCPLLVVLSMTDTLAKDFLNLKALEQQLKVPVVPVQGLTGEGIFDLVRKLQLFSKNRKLNKELNKDYANQPRPITHIKKWNLKKFRDILVQSKKIVSDAGYKKGEEVFSSHKLDRFFLHPIKGLFLFAGIMFSLFCSIFWLATPFMDGVDQVFSFLIDQSAMLLSPWPYLSDFVSKGLLSSLGAVLVFVPQIFILWIGISLLEGTGYLARAVALMDGPLSKIGLSGASFVPFLSGYACAIPSILSVRNLKSLREKTMTIFAVPFMSCSARLPVYALLLSFLFYGQAGWKPGFVLGLIYISSGFLGMLAVFILDRFLKKEKAANFLIDLPLYRPPQLRKILSQSIRQTKHYIFKAGPAVFTFALLIWGLSQFPIRPELSPVERIQQSWAAQIGKFTEPLIEYMGLDWRVGLALIAAFAAREVFVSVLALVFSVSALTEKGLSLSLLENMKNATHVDGSPLFTAASVTALIVFFMFSLQCLSTTAVVYRETRSVKLASFQLIALNILAFVMAIGTYQGLNWLL